MDFNPKKKKMSFKTDKLEKNLAVFLKNLLKDNIGPKRKEIFNKGFFYYYCRNRYMFKYSLSHTTKDKTFEEVTTDKIFFTKLIKSWSARFNRYIIGSEKAAQSIKKDSNHVITYPTIGNQLCLSEFLILTENLSDEEVINLIRPKK